MQPICLKPWPLPGASGRLEGWAGRNPKEQNKDNCKVAPLECRKPVQWHKLWRSSVEKTVVDLKMNMLWQ